MDLSTKTKKSKIKEASEAQMRYLDKVNEIASSTGWYPSQRQIGKELGYKSPATSVTVVQKLEEMGLVEWNRHCGIRPTERGQIELLIWRSPLRRKLTEQEGREILAKSYAEKAIKNLRLAVIQISEMKDSDATNEDENPLSHLSHMKTWIGCCKEFERDTAYLLEIFSGK